MNTQEAIKTRRSTKSFDPSHQISDEETNQIISLAMHSPTAFNIQHWRFVLVSDRHLRSEIKKVAWNQPQVTDSSLLIVLCADLKAWEKHPERYWVNASPEAKDFILPAIDDYYRNKEQTQRDEAMRSCGIAAQTLMLAAQSMGYNSCPMDGFDFGAVAKLINLPDDHIIAMFVAVGKTTDKPWPRGGQLTLSEVTIHNRWETSSSMYIPSEH